MTGANPITSGGLFGSPEWVRVTDVLFGIRAEIAPAVEQIEIAAFWLDQDIDT